MGNGKHCIIGANSTIAQSLIRMLLNQGDSLHLVARNEADLERYKGMENISTAIADVIHLDQLKAAILGCPDTFKSLSYFPGTIALKDIKSITEDDFNHHLKVNTTSGFFAVQYALDKLKEAQGSVLFFSSVAAQKGFSNHSIISTCKAGIEGLTVALAKELAPSIRVNCIAPSLMETKLSQPLTSNPSVRQALAKAHALNRLGTPEDAAHLAEFLITEKSTWITGQIMGLDGGRSSLD